MLYYAEHVQRETGEWNWTGSGGVPANDLYAMRNLWNRAERGEANVIVPGTWTLQDRAMGRDIVVRPKRVTIRP